MQAAAVNRESQRPRKRFLPFSCANAILQPNTMNTVNVPFENGELSLPLPDDWKIVDTIRPIPHSKVDHVDAALVQALDHPIGSQVALCDRNLARRRIVLCVEDISRPTPTAQYFG